jgi:hypothetical protein
MCTKSGDQGICGCVSHTSRSSYPMGNKYTVNLRKLQYIARSIARHRFELVSHCIVHKLFSAQTGEAMFNIRKLRVLTLMDLVIFCLIVTSVFKIHEIKHHSISATVHYL